MDGSTLWSSSGVLRTEWVGGQPTIKLTTAGPSQLYFDINFAPQNMTLYAKFKQGSGMGDFDAVFQVGSTSATADPRWAAWSDGTYYTCQYDNGSAAATATLSAAPSTGDTVEIRAVLLGSGNVELHQSVNGGAETTATSSSTAVTLSSTWAASKLWVGCRGANAHASMNVYAVKVHTGTRSLDYMRALS